MKTSNVVRGLLVAALWAICYGLITLAVRSGDALIVAALRAAIAGASVGVFAVFQRRSPPTRTELRVIVALGATATAMGFGGMFLAGGRISPGLAELVSSVQPPVAAIIMWVVWRTPITGRQRLSMAMAIAGIALVVAPALLGENDTLVTVEGLGFVGVGALGVAIGNIIMSRTEGDALVLTAGQLLFGSLMLGLLALVTGSTSIHWDVPFVLALLGLAVPGTAVAYALWFDLLSREPLNSVNIFSYIAPVIGLGIGAAFFQERLNPLQLGGAAVVICSLWVASRSTKEAPQPDHRLHKGA